MAMSLSDKISLAVEVRTNLRFLQKISVNEIRDIFKNPALYDALKHTKYFLSFFENCYPSLIKKFMFVHGITREEILFVLNKLPDTAGETVMFKEKINAGEF